MNSSMLSTLSTLPAYFMGIFGPSRGGLSGQTLPEGIQTSSWYGLDTYGISARQAYEKSAPVAFAMERMKEVIGTARPMVKQLKGERYAEISLTHPLSRLMRYPCTKKTAFEFYSEIIANKSLFGSAFVYLMGQPNGAPEEMQIVRPERMRIVPSIEMGQIAGFIYEVNGSQIPLRVDEVVQFKRWNPYNDFSGLSLLSSAQNDIQAHYNAGQWNAHFFGENNAIPALAVEVQGQITTDEFNRLQREWKSTGGINRGTRFFRSGAGMANIKIHDIGLDPLDASFMTGRSANRKEILDLFGVPESLFDKGATEASANVGQQLFYDIAWYQLKYLAQVFDLELAPFFGSELGEYTVEFEDTRPTNVQNRIAEIETAKQFLSIDEIRATYYDLEAVEWGTGPAAGAGSAYLQFLGGGIGPNQATGRDLFQGGNRNPNNVTTPNEDKEQQPREDGNEGKALTIRECAILAQKTALKMFDEHKWSPDSVPLQGIPQGYQVLIKTALQLVKERDDILKAFNPLFDSVTEETKPLKAAGDTLLRKINRLPKQWQTDILNTTNEVRDAFGFAERLRTLTALPQEIEDALNVETVGVL